MASSFLLGESARAERLVGLAEEVDGRTGEMLGNFPHASTHTGLINAAHAIAEAE